jgi:hypothetical protein
MSDVHRHQVATDLGGVNPTRDQDNCAALCNQLFSFGVVTFNGSRVRKLLLNLFEVFQPGEV